MSKFWKFVKQLFHRKHFRKLTTKDLYGFYPKQEFVDIEIYCIVCCKTVKLSEVREVRAEEKYGGWYCARHTVEELNEARSRLNGLVSDQHGNLYEKE